MKPISVGLVGLGTVAQGTLTVLANNRQELSRRVGREIQITHIGARRDRDDVDLSGINVSRDLMDVARDPDVEVFVELIGGCDYARELIEAAIESGKHIVTANKALIAEHGNLLFERAQARGVTIAFEASVAGGIPVIKALREGLAANQIQWLAGIINGTGNFILTEMRDKGRDFADVLAEAQELGYAEADPTFDVEGIDAAHKLCILASIAFGIPLNFDSVYTQGISSIDLMDLDYAEELGYRIKHLGIARRTERGIEMRVHPTLIPESQLLANVNGVMNAVQIHGDAVGSTLHYGPGAGSLPTASAVVADLVDVARALTADPTNRVPHLAFQPAQLNDLPILPIHETVSPFYVRLSVRDEVGVLAYITRTLAEHDVSLESVIQKDGVAGEPVALILLTHKVREKYVLAALGQIEQQSFVVGTTVVIRCETLGGFA
ncbi:MAG: homoserine dehydrogenase [Oceanospirillales bacterium TMED33]|nr:homoserine dehydrogenase [Gammaproteobacteria bacterium]RPG21603.1 MAG: homoserine dehydrogenase [Oceanospirillales bacterium TMED33]CAI8286523.1 MAG: Homoserine dehydrogenase [Gammaproteobacteria bacterium]